MRSNRAPIIRTQSEMYHHVYTSTPINESRFDSNSIIGPEFVVRSWDTPKEIQLKAASIEKMKNLRSVLVILPSGHRIKLKCNPLVATLEQIFNAVINEQKINFSQYLSLAFSCNGEFHFPELKTKVYKVAPTGWDNNKNIVVIETFTIYLRFLYYPRIDNPRYLPNKFTNMLYLQLRHDFLEGRIQVSMPTMLSLASLTLQAEFGIANKESGRYFMVEHYLPEAVHDGDDDKEAILEKELAELHRSLKLSPNMAKTQYISRIHGTLSYGTQIYEFFDKRGKQQMLAVSLDGLKVVLDPPSFEKLLEADLIPWSAIKKFDISSHKLTVASSSKAKLKNLKLFYNDNRYKYVWNVCSNLKRWQQKQTSIGYAYFDNSINTATQKCLVKSNSELNLHHTNGITRHPDATPVLQNCHNEKTNRMQGELSASCLNLTEREYFLPHRRLSSTYHAMSIDDTLVQDTSRDLMSYAETTEYPDSSGNSCLMKKRSPKPNVVTYFPSEGNCSPVKASNASQDPVNLGSSQSSNTFLDKATHSVLDAMNINMVKRGHLRIKTQPKTDIKTCENALFQPPSTKLGKTTVLPVVTTAQESSLSSVSLAKSVKTTLFPSAIQTHAGATRAIQSPPVLTSSRTHKSPIKVNHNTTDIHLKRSLTNVNESSHVNGAKRNATIIKVTSFRESSSPSRLQSEVFRRKKIGSKIVELEDLSDSDFSPYSSPKKTSIGVKMGTKVTTAILQKHKLPRSCQSPCSEEGHHAVVIEPNATGLVSPIRGPEESIDDSLVQRFLAAPSPEFGLAERKLITVSLTRSEGSLGITILQASDGSLYIGELVHGSPAFKDGILKQGDRLMGVNGFSVENLSCERAVSLLQSSLDPVQLLVSQPIENKDFKSRLLEINTSHKDKSFEILEKHVTIIKVSSGPSSLDYFSANSLSPSEPISV